jgi:hypothetical protein
VRTHLALRSRLHRTTQQSRRLYPPFGMSPRTSRGAAQPVAAQSQRG